MATHRSVEEIEYRSLNRDRDRERTRGGDASLLRRAESFGNLRAVERRDEYLHNDLRMLSREVEVLGRKHRRPSGRDSQLRLDARLPEDEQYNVFLDFADESLGEEYTRSRRRAVLKVTPHFQKSHVSCAVGPRCLRPSFAPRFVLLVAGVDVRRHGLDGHRLLLPHAHPPRYTRNHRPTHLKAPRN